MANFGLFEDPNPYRTNYKTTREGVGIDLAILHGTDSTADTLGPDSGTANMDAWLVHPDCKVSWHATVDSDSVRFVLPDHYQAYHAGHNGINANRRSLGVEQNYKPDDWPSLPAEYRAKVMDNTARVVALWCRRHDLPIEHLGLKSETAKGRGVTDHSVVQPETRSDPGWKPAEIDTFMRTVEYHAATPLVAIGDQGDDVTAVQELLVSEGYSLEVDGIFGPVTDEMTRWWQQSRGEARTGIIAAHGQYGPDPEPTLAERVDALEQIVYADG